MLKWPKVLPLGTIFCLRKLQQKIQREKRGFSLMTLALYPFSLNE